MSSLPLELGLVQTTSDQHHQSEQVLFAEIADLSLPELAPPPSSSNLVLEHFSHDHPLILFEVVKVEGENNDVQLTTTVGGLGQESVLCLVCRDDPVSNDGPIYRCRTTGCSDNEKFILHKSCAELPMKIVSAFHPGHLLKLLPPGNYFCDICREYIFGFTYRCGPCQFDLHITCALLPNFEPKRHDEQHHSFILFKPSTFTCDACGIHLITKMVSYLCTTCQIQVHPFKSCSSSSYPLKLKQIRHRHQLILTFSYQLDFDFSHKSCMICYNKMNNVSRVYYCSTCAYIAHVKCATSEKVRDNAEYQIQDDAECDLATKFIQPGPPVDTSSPVGEGEDQKATELLQQQQQLLKHFSHPHCLILSNDEPKIDQLCDGCRWPISVPLYTCPTDQCNFSLHKQCAELPGKIRHPLHRHQVTIKEKHPEEIVFKCPGCAIYCNGFTYTCDECEDFYLCVRCGLFSYTLSHEGHQCPLNIMPDIMPDSKTKCSACGLNNCSAKFICVECNFNLCLRCASLPKVTMHNCPKPDWGIRPITLTYSSVEDESGEYYCDICEERKGQNHWFYYCEACDYSCHPRCILGKHLIKFGETYNFKIHHHPLTVVKNVKGRATGANCDDSCKDSPLLVCPKCDICKHNHFLCEFWRI